MAGGDAGCIRRDRRGNVARNIHFHFIFFCTRSLDGRFNRLWGGSCMHSHRALQRQDQWTRGTRRLRSVAHTHPALAVCSAPRGPGRTIQRRLGCSSCGRTQQGTALAADRAGGRVWRRESVPCVACRAVRGVAEIWRMRVSRSMYAGLAASRECTFRRRNDAQHTVISAWARYRYIVGG